MDTECDKYAFPGKIFNREGYMTGNGNGMELRDWFAGQALSNISAMYSGSAMDPVGTAKAAYDLADAMLEARK